MSPLSSADQRLYVRGLDTLFAAWREYARGSADAVVQRLPGVTTAIFPCEPERSVYNNAVLEPGMAAGARAAAIEAMQSAYAEQGVARFAAWVQASDLDLRHDLQRRGYARDTSTLAMGLRLDDLRGPPPQLELVELEWSDYLRMFELPAGLLARADHAALQLLVARDHDAPVATLLAYDFAGDCGIYNVSTLEHARRRGMATALTLLAAHAARARGCRTASLQSTEMAERVYAAVGFRDLGRILEYVPPPAALSRSGGTRS